MSVTSGVFFSIERSFAMLKKAGNYNNPGIKIIGINGDSITLDFNNN